MGDAHEGDAAFVASPKRFLTLGLYCAISFLWAGPWICFAPLSDIAEARFDVGAAAINNLAASYLFLYVPGTALCLYVVDRFGVRVCLASSVTVNTAVVFVRWLALASPGLSPHAQYAITMAAQVRTVERSRQAQRQPALAAASKTRGDPWAVPAGCALGSSGAWRAPRRAAPTRHCHMRGAAPKPGRGRRLSSAPPLRSHRRSSRSWWLRCARRWPSTCRPGSQATGTRAASATWPRLLPRWPTFAGRCCFRCSRRCWCTRPRSWAA